MRTVMIILALTGLLGFGPCENVRESDRQLNDQNKGAGEFIEKTSTQPEVAQAGKDVKENSLQLEAGAIGKPAAPATYSPQKSQEEREKSKEEHKGMGWLGWLGAIAGIGASFVGAGGVMTPILTRIFPRAMGGPAVKVAMSVIDGVARAREKAAETPDKKLSLDVLIGELAKAKYDLPPKYQDLLKAWVHEKEAELAAKQ